MGSDVLSMPAKLLNSDAHNFLSAILAISKVSLIESWESVHKGWIFSGVVGKDGK